MKKKKPMTENNSFFECTKFQVFTLYLEAENSSAGLKFWGGATHEQTILRPELEKLNAFLAPEAHNPVDPEDSLLNFKGKNNEPAKEAIFFPQNWTSGQSKFTILRVTQIDLRLKNHETK